MDRLHTISKLAGIKTTSSKRCLLLAEVEDSFGMDGTGTIIIHRIKNLEHEAGLDT